MALNDFLRESKWKLLFLSFLNVLKNDTLDLFIDAFDILDCYVVYIKAAMG